VAGPVYEFGGFRLDCGRFELSRDGSSIPLERKPMELLLLLVERQGELVTRAEIAQRLWSSEVFVDTEHGINTAVRKIRNLLRDSPEHPRFVQTVTGMGYRFIASVASPVPVPGSSNVAAEPFAVPPGANGTPAPARAHPRPWLVIGTTAALAIVTLALVPGIHHLAARLLHRDAAPAITSLAIIPLDNLSGDPRQNYFADGMTDELTTMLARNSTLHITSRTSAMQFKGGRESLPAIAQSLHVDGILEGSVSRSGNQVHMTLQLIRADTDTHLWAESYDRSLNELAALPGEAARDIANHLHSAVPASAPARYVNPEAHDAYQRGRYLWFRGQREEAGKNFRKAVELQPDYALGWTGLADYYGEAAGAGAMNPLQALPQADALARKAVALDDRLPEAHLSLGANILTSRWDWAHAMEEISRALELNPRLVQAIHFRARMLSLAGRYQEAIQAQKAANEIGPFERPWATVTLLDEARQYDAAIEEARQRLQAEPDSGLYRLMADAYRSKGMDKEWADAWEKYLRLSGDPASASAFQRAYRLGGRKAALHWQLDQLQRKARSAYVSPVDLALIHAQLGDREQTLSLLEQGVREHSPLLLWIHFDLAYDFLNNDERYRSIIQRVGITTAS
jgi:TolB-like protein/DNA-binding winged helix-turn-helix (wHTH) protein